MLLNIYQSFFFYFLPFADLAGYLEYSAKQQKLVTYGIIIVLVLLILLILVSWWRIEKCEIIQLLILLFASYSTRNSSNRFFYTSLNDIVGLSCRNCTSSYSLFWFVLKSGSYEMWLKVFNLSIWETIRAVPDLLVRKIFKITSPALRSVSTRGHGMQS